MKALLSSDWIRFYKMFFFSAWPAVPGLLEKGKPSIHIQVRARSFLHHQVRNFAGTLKLVGEGKWSAGDIAAILAARDRTRAGPTAPPEGLYLVKVGY